MCPYRNAGPKAFGGGAALDNGYAKFDRVRIPKEHMLSKFAHVSDDGEYVKPPHAKMSYGGVRPYLHKSMAMLLSDRCCLVDALHSCEVNFFHHHFHHQTSIKTC
jgi:hypothetical protein